MSRSLPEVKLLALISWADDSLLRILLSAAVCVALALLALLTWLGLRAAMFMIFLAGLALMLMTFPGVRQIGASLLASAGVVGIVAGFSNLMAGLQMALTQPFRLDDVLIVKGEWGRVE